MAPDVSDSARPGEEVNGGRLPRIYPPVQIDLNFLGDFVDRINNAERARDRSKQEPVRETGMDPPVGSPASEAQPNGTEAPA